MRLSSIVVISMAAVAAANQHINNHHMQGGVLGRMALAASSFSSTSSTISGCGYGVIDLAAIYSGPYDRVGYDDNGGSSYYFMNMCGVVNDDVCRQHSATSMLCQVTKADATQVVSLADFAGGTGGSWSYLNGNSSQGVQVNYTNGDGNCFNVNTGETEQRVTTMRFICDLELEEETFFVTTAQPCQYNMHMRTPVACIGGGGIKPSYSPGGDDIGSMNTAMSRENKIELAVLVVVVLFMFKLVVIQTAKAVASLKERQQWIYTPCLPACGVAERKHGYVAFAIQYLISVLTLAALAADEWSKTTQSPTTKFGVLEIRIAASVNAPSGTIKYQDLWDCGSTDPTGEIDKDLCNTPIAAAGVVFACGLLTIFTATFLLVLTLPIKTCACLLRIRSQVMLVRSALFIQQFAALACVTVWGVCFHQFEIDSGARSSEIVLGASWGLMLCVTVLAWAAAMTPFNQAAIATVANQAATAPGGDGVMMMQNENAARSEYLQV